MKIKTFSFKIKIGLLKKGITQAEIARQCGVSRQMVSLVINGHGISSRVQDKISEILEIPKTELFRECA